MNGDTYSLENIKYWMDRAATAERTLDAVIRQRDAAEATLSKLPEDVRKDAERYRWLRSHETGYGYQTHGGAMWASGADLDAAIDAERSTAALDESKETKR